MPALVNLLASRLFSGSALRSSADCILRLNHSVAILASFTLKPCLVLLACHTQVIGFYLALSADDCVTAGASKAVLGHMLRSLFAQDFALLIFVGTINLPGG